MNTMQYGAIASRPTTAQQPTIVKMARKNHQTLVLVTHDDVLAHYADRIVTLIDGKIVKDELNNAKL